MRKLIRKMKREQLKRVSRSVVTVGLALGMATGSAILGSGDALAFDTQTTTVGLAVSHDKDAVTSVDARVVNLGLMGIDNLGNVDVLAEAGGSTILAAVTSVLGTVQGGDANPTSATVTAGTLAASTRYVSVNNGRGIGSVAYAASVEGTDTISIKLYERRSVAGGTLETQEIASKSFTVSVARAAASTGILNVESFTAAGGDAQGVNGAAAAPASDTANTGLVVATRMSAGYAGGQIVVNAYTVNANRTYTADGNAEGEVTVTFTGTKTAEAQGGNIADGTTYTVTGQMSQGTATITLPSTIEKSGVYTMVASMDGVDSIPETASNVTANTDFITIAPETTPVKVGLTVDMATVMNSNSANYAVGNHRATVTASLLDQFGNKVIPADHSDKIAKFEDANSKVSISQVAFGGANNTLTQVVTADTNGAASITASIKDSNVIGASDALAMSVKAAGFVRCTGAGAPVAGCGAAVAFTAGDQAAGAPFNLLVGDGLAHSDNSNFTAGAGVSVYSAATKQTASSSADNVVDPVTNLAVLFTTSTAAITDMIIVDPAAEYGSYKETPVAYAVAAATPTVATLRTDIVAGNGNVLDDVSAALQNNGTFTSTFNMQHYRLFDSFGNEDLTGGAAIKFQSASGTVTTNSQVPGTNNNTVISYPAGTTADDTLTFTFTGAPGVPASGVNSGAGIKVSFPTTSLLNEFVVYPESTEPLDVPINGVLVLDVYPRSEDGENVAQADGYKITYDPNGIALLTTAGVAIANGTVTPGGTARYGIRVDANSIPGVYPITITSLDDTVTKTVEIKVVEYTVALTLGNTAITVAPGASGTVEIIGGQGPFTVVSADETVVTASVDGNSLVLAAVAEGGPVNVTVTDSQNTDAIVAVTIHESGVIPPLGDAFGIDAEGNSVATTATFSGGISVAGGELSSSATVSQEDQVAVQVTIAVDADDQGQAGDILAIVGYMPVDGVMSWFIKPELDTENWVQWYGDMAALTPFRSVTELGTEEILNIFTGQLEGIPGTTQAYGAYRLEDGSIFWNQQPVVITVQ